MAGEFRLSCFSMPLVYQHNINQSTKLAVWHITEPDDFFLASVPLKRDVSHPHKRLQHLAGRYLLPFLFPDFPLEEILIADTRKPFLENESYHFSISHCGNYAAAIVSASSRVGIDIENISPKIERVQHKFAGASEMQWFNQYQQLNRGAVTVITDKYLEFLTVLWSAKESIFKWYGHGQMDFKMHMQLQAPVVLTGNHTEMVLPFIVTKQMFRAVNIQARLFDGMALAWLYTD
jgi:4'-phosphopantetheinyl transferase EntD